jgi:hypothetical protein
MDIKNISKNKNMMKIINREVKTMRHLMNVKCKHIVHLVHDCMS